MRLDIITLFPAMFAGPLSESIMGRAQEKGLVEITLVDPRDFTHDKHRSVDERPYGGGAGMVMRPEPLFEAVESRRQEDSRVILLSPQGQLFKQAKAAALAKYEHLILICGHYEGVDERIRLGLADEEISIGDYILTNGGLAAMVVADAVTRLLPGVLGSAESLAEESFSHCLLEYPQYTRPEEFRGLRVPPVLLSGHHQEIAEWRRQQAVARTRERRPDLMQQAKDQEAT